MPELAKPRGVLSDMPRCTEDLSPGEGCNCGTEGAKRGATPADLFRELRGNWFRAKVESYPHERMWESEADAEGRERGNDRDRERFDAQTEELLRGEEGPKIAPLCAADLYWSRDA